MSWLKYDSQRVVADGLYRKALEILDGPVRKWTLRFCDCPHTAFDCRCAPRAVLQYILSRPQGKTTLTEEERKRWILAEYAIKYYEESNWFVLNLLRKYKL